MIPIQKTIAYQGDVAQSPLSTVRLALRFPVFEYEEDIENGAVSRTALTTDWLEADHELTNKTYRLMAPTANLIGKNGKAIRGFLSYTIQALTARNIEALLFEMPVSFWAASIQIAAPPLEALYLIRNTAAWFDAQRVLMRARPLPDLADAAAFLEKNIFLINKAAYNELLSRFGTVTGHSDSWTLYAILTQFLDAANIDPIKTVRLNDEQLSLLLRRLLEENIENGETAVELINKQFADLFDFPLLVPELKSLKIAGTFEVKMPPDVSLTKDDLHFYHLSADLTMRDANNRPVSKLLNYDWTINTEPITANRIPFNLTQNEPLLLNALSEPVMVSVKGFDGSTLWSKAFAHGDPTLQQLEIVVAQLRPMTITPVTNGQPETGKKLRGQVLELSKRCSLKDLTIVIQAKKEGDAMWRVVAATNTDASGNFSTSYPYGEYTEAQALVSLTPDSPADISIKETGNKNETIADDFLYLLVNNPDCIQIGHEDDCDCDATQKAPRLPDQADLINSDQYTQDIGGSCINLSTPNRTLSEFSYSGIVRTSDPDVANYTLVKKADGTNDWPDRFSFELKSDQKKIQRKPVDLDNPIRWQDAPDSNQNLTLYQSVTVATGHVLHYRSVFKADGYSLGNLLYSLALAPGQKKQIVVMDSAHSLQGAETQNIAQGESLAAALLNERDIVSQLGGNVNEAMSGRSSASTGGVSAGLGVAGSYGGMISAALGVAGGYASSNASASQNSSRQTAMFFGEKLRQSIMQNAESYRQLNATVVTTVTEGQQYSVTTDVVANHNHCHALTMMYFEVLRHYAIYQELVNVEECIFVPLLMTNFTTENIYKWSDVLARNLLPLSANTYLQPFSFLRYRVRHPLIPAFDANERIKTNYAHVEFPKGAYSDEPITAVTGYLTIRVRIPRPQTKYDRIMSFPVVKKEQITNKNGGGIFGAIADAVVGERNDIKTWEEKVKFTDDHIFIYDSFQHEARPADVIEVIKFDDVFSSGSKDGDLWEAIANLCGYTNVAEFLANYFSHKTIAQWDATFNAEIAPMLFEALVDKALSIPPFSSFDATTVGKYNGGERQMRLNLRGDTSLARKDILSIRVNYSKTVNKADKFWPFVTFTLENLNINYTTKHYQGFIINKYIGDDLYDNNGVNNPTIPTPMNTDEQRNPRMEDRYIVLKLIEHLNSNLEHYNKVLWYNLDPDRRYMMLDGFHIQIYNDFGVPEPEKRSLASVVKNQLLAITGNSLVFPVAAGYKVSQSFIMAKNEAGEAERVELLDHYKPYTPIPPYRISVPSRGVFVEAVQGQCDACERVKENSSQDWTIFTTDEPTTVLPVQTPTPTITDWKAMWKEFAPPLINIQNAPALPEPGAGTANVAELLGKSGIFKDITGLDATQQNVMRTYLSNQENAKAFAEMAKNMVMQEHNTKNSDKIMNSLQNAKDSGAINQQDYGKLVKEHLQKQIDGGEAQNKQAERESKKQETSPIKSAVDLAQSGNKDVSATESDGQGNVKMLDVKVKGGSEQKYNFAVPGKIEPLKQQTQNACWATVTTMMANWKYQRSQTVQEYITSVGAEYVPYIQTGIPVPKLEAFCGATGLKMAHSNTMYPVSFYHDILQKNGPIWVIDLESSDPKMLHGRLLTGIKGDDSSATTMFTIIDPATGSRYDEALPTFIQKTENVVKTIDAVKDVQIPLLIYYQDSYDKANYVDGATSSPTIGTGADNQTRVRSFVPTNEDQLVVDGREVGAVTNLLNWRAMYKNADGSFSQAKMDADRNFDDPINPGRKKYCAGPYRAPTELDKVVLHETAGFGNYKAVSQFNVAIYTRPDGTKSAYKAMPHFCINTDGVIMQFLDVCEHADHGEGLSSSSVGIEFVNHPWGKDGASQDGTVKGGITPLKIPAIAGLPSLDNKHVTTCLYIPAQAQLEALVTLLNALFAATALSNLKKNWLNVININPKNFATEKLDDLHAYFILNNAKTYLKDTKYAAINANITSDGWSLDTPGVYNHSLFGGHTDGMLQSFYTWLRIGQKMNQTEAMTTFKDSIGDKNKRQSAGNSVTLVDVSQIVFATA